MTETTERHSAPTGEAKDTCPDPTDPYTDYRVSAAGADKAAELYKADADAVGAKYATLDGAQDKYQNAKSEQEATLHDLKGRLDRIEDALDCLIKEDVRGDLRCCWKQVRDEADKAAAGEDCSRIEKLDCARLPAEPGQLRELETLAERCATQTDTRFDDLAALPDGIAGKVTDVATRATGIEQQLASSRSDPRRAYVEYLRLDWDYERLIKDLPSAAQHACNLKAAFVRLLDYHTKVICVSVAVAELDKRAQIEDENRQKRDENFVDVVLECALRGARPADVAGADDRDAGPSSGERGCSSAPTTRAE